MTSVGLVIVMVGVGLIWAGITDTPPVETFKSVVSGKPAPTTSKSAKSSKTAEAPPATPVVAQPKVVG